MQNSEKYDVIVVGAGAAGMTAATVAARGGVNLKEVDPKTMESRLANGLYFCGELLDIDAPHGGYNLQWAFSSGYLARISILRGKS